MNTLRTIVVVSTCLIASLWWAVSVTGEKPAIMPAPSLTQELQCPPGSRIADKVCACAPGSEWSGSQCTAKPLHSPQLPQPLQGPHMPQPDTRHVTTVDLRRR